MCSRTTEDRGTFYPCIPPPPTLPRKIEHTPINISPSTLAGDWKKLFNCEDLSDAIFLLGPKMYHAHKYVLCCASDIFRKIFEREGTIKASYFEVRTCPKCSWNQKRLHEVSTGNISDRKVAGLKDIQYRLVHSMNRLSLLLWFPWTV